MKNNLFARVIGINLLVYAALFAFSPMWVFYYFFLFFFGNLLIGWAHQSNGKKEMAYTHYIAAFVVTLIGLGTCAIIMSNLNIGGGRHPNT